MITLGWDIGRGGTSGAGVGKSESVKVGRSAGALWASEEQLGALWASEEQLGALWASEEQLGALWASEGTKYE
jgi:hypothetical protein